MKTSLIITISVIISNLTFAHGENKLGPHNGYIRMPGAFHTELVPNNETTFNVYLMDVNNTNQTTKESSVKLTYTNKKQSSAFTCLPVENYFTCKSKVKINVNEGSIILNAVRLNKTSSDALYELPFKLK